ncbi:MAG TPA: STAS domain-containing protein, partial [Planctomycetaceae bacterium]|nr:STAS domain-containing protein [Planctomycetaceae bacterium]
AVQTNIPEILRKSSTELLHEWMEAQKRAFTYRGDLIKEGELREQSREFLSLLQTATSSGEVSSIDGEIWAPMRDFLTDVSRSRGERGFTPAETATFVFSFKEPLFVRIRAAAGNDAETLARDTWAATTLLDKLGLYTTTVHQQVREQIIDRQQQEMLELSTPVVKLWEGILALPLIGTLDSSRTQVVMENLLQTIVDTESEIAIIDITGVPTVDTLTAQHLLKTVAAARLMGAECIISGIRPQIAQTVVHLGVDLSHVVTKASLADAFIIALNRTGKAVVNATTVRAH